MRKMTKILAIVGQTATGKTALSIGIAGALSGEVISADSRQVYKGLDIGTGKVRREEMGDIPHHLLDVAEPAQVFTAAEYLRLGRLAISDIARRGHLPVVVGGTGFYIDALLGRTRLSDVPPNPAFRKGISQLDLDELNGLLEKLDPERAKAIDKKNKMRVVRAIEVAKSVQTPTVVSKATTDDVLWLGITLTPEELKKKIHTRLEARLEAGMLEEAKRLHAGGLSYERMDELGLEYRYMARFLQGKISYEEMKEQLEREIRKYAKRQMTWFKRNKEIHWFPGGDYEGPLAEARAWLKKN
jgi:tRNA dimethylallyltransferase